MMHVGLDLCRSRVDVHVLDAAGKTVLVTKAPVDADGLAGFAAGIDARFGVPVQAVVESMTGARHVHDVLTAAGWEVAVADAAKVKGLAPLACKTDKIDSWVLARLSYLDLVPVIWLPSMLVRQDRERARFRLHLVKHRSMLKQRIHATLMAFGIPAPEADLFGAAGRDRLARLAVPEPWATNVAASLRLIDVLDRDIDAIEADLRRLGADHRYIPRLMTVPGIGWVLAFTIASELGDITRFPSPVKLVGYTGLCAKVYQSGQRDRRGPLTKAGPKYLRWALIEAATHACAHPHFATKYQRTRQRLGRQRGPKVARIEVARELATAIWHMLTTDQDFHPTRAGAAPDLAA